MDKKYFRRWLEKIQPDIIKIEKIQIIVFNRHPSQINFHNFGGIFKG